MDGSLVLLNHLWFNRTKVSFNCHQERVGLEAGFCRGRSFLWNRRHRRPQAAYPEARGDTRCHLRGDFPIWPCSRWGLPCRRVLPPTRCALTAPFHPCRRHCWRLGGLLSVALSVGSRRPGVTWHLVRRSPDFPPHLVRNAATVRPTPARTISA